MTREFRWLIAFLCLFASLNASAQRWQWVDVAACDNGAPSQVATDPSGNVYVGGSFVNPSVSFGSITLTNSHTDGVSNQMFLAKYDGAGDVLWAKQAGGWGVFSLASLATDPWGNVYVTGSYSGDSVNFGGVTLFSTNDSFRSVFLAKYNSAGNVVWARRTTRTYYNADATSVAADAFGNVYVAGPFSNVIAFGPDTAYSADMDANDMYLVKYDSAGNYQWLRTSVGSAVTGGTSSDYQNYSLVTDRAGYVYVKGAFYNDSVAFGAITLDNPQVYGYASDLYFVAKYAPDGTPVWAKRALAQANAAAPLTIDAQDHIYIGGSFQNYVVVAPGDTVRNTSPSFTDMFVAKFDTAWHMAWARTGSGILNDWIASLAADVAGNLYAAGYSASPSLVFGSLDIPLAGEWIYTGVVIKIDSTGNGVWQNTVLNCTFPSMAGDNTGNIYVTGVGAPARLGTVFIGDTGIYVAKIDTLTPTSVTGTTRQQDDILLYPNPVSASLTISATMPINTIEITDLTGQTVITQTGNAQSVQLDVSALSPGMYLVRINDTEVRKFVK